MSTGIGMLGKKKVVNFCHFTSTLLLFAPPYLSDDFHRLVDIPSRRRLRSASSLQLDVSRTHRRTVGDRAFAAAGPTLWNSLPYDITTLLCVAVVILPETENFFVFYIISMTTFCF